MTVAKLTINGNEYELPIIEGTMGEKAIDIANLRAQTGFVALDNGYANVGSCRSDITFIDGDKGILKIRGIPIEILAEKCTFLEVCYLLIYKKLPNAEELKKFRTGIKNHALLHEGMKHFFEGFPDVAHPMAILSSMVSSMSAYNPRCIEMNPEKEVLDENIIRLLSQIRTLAAFAYKKSIGQPFVYARQDLTYISNFLNMMFDTPNQAYERDADVERALELLFILHADHEQNCSTSTVRLVGSSGTNMYSCISSGINALWGPLHGGANQQVLYMLQKIVDEGISLQKVIDKAKDKNDPFRLMGFGHRVYKNLDPRAVVIKSAADKVLAKLGINDPLLHLAKQLEEKALTDSYFIEKKLYPNIDFYSGIIYKAIGIPVDMFTVMFAIGRLPGWITQFLEMKADPNVRIGRPRQIYVGPPSAEFIPIEQRG